MKRINKPARVYLAGTVGIGLLALLNGALHWSLAHPLLFVTYLICGWLGSLMKLSLPGIQGTLSVNFFFILVSVIQLSLGETLVVGVSSFLFQYLWRGKSERRPAQAAFNVASGAVAMNAAYQAFHWSWLRAQVEMPIALAVAAAVYFIANTSQVASIIALTENRKVHLVWLECHIWMLPYYLLGAWMAGAFDYATRQFGWTVTMLTLPALAMVHYSYHLYLSKLHNEKERAESEKAHAEEMSALHLRTIEALALAIEAKDETTNQHLQRVQIYALALGRELGLRDSELDALRAASLLHDIGKLAVPEHIISKPGKLTPEEFEKMKIHPVVGAEIVECVGFPYDVASIVRSHHEKWDGSGYPDGLAGEAIPIGARILSVVDCLDALASDRQYRRAVPLEESMKRVEAAAGEAFDPRVVAVLSRRYLELEELARGAPQPRMKLSKGLKVERGLAPATGFEATPQTTQITARGSGGAQSPKHPPRHPAALPANTDLGPGSPATRPLDFLQSIGAARQEAQLLFEMANELGPSLELAETLSMFATRIQRLIPHNTMAVYRLTADECLETEFATGSESKLFLTLQIPVGEGLSGWVAANRLPIINGNPSVEPGYLNDPRMFSRLRSALSIPLTGPSGITAGVLTLYEAQKDAFSRDHLRILQAVSSKLGQTIEHSVQFRRAEDDATTDFLTGLPNARSLFVQLELEIAACTSALTPLVVLVGDLDGFKQVNDLLGHLEGNRVLQCTAAALRAQSRPRDFVARMGGDEFVMILPGITPDRIEAVRNRLARAVRLAWEETGCVTANGRLASSGDSIELGLSLGYSVLGQDGQTAEELLAVADQRMYQEKSRQGGSRRQRVPAAESLTLPLLHLEGALGHGNGNGNGNGNGPSETGVAGRGMMGSMTTPTELQQETDG